MYHETPGDVLPLGSGRSLLPRRSRGYPADDPRCRLHHSTSGAHTTTLMKARNSHTLLNSVALGTMKVIKIQAWEEVGELLFQVAKFA